MNEKVNDVIKKLKKILFYKNAIDDNAFCDNMAINNEALIDNGINSLEHIVERLEYVSTHIRSQYGMSRLSEQFGGEANPNDKPSFITYYKQDISSNLAYLKGSGVISTVINNDQAIIKLGISYTFLYEILEVSISKKEGDVVKYTSEKYKFTKTSDNKYEVVIPLGEAKSLSGSESRVFNFYLLYRDDIYFSLNADTLKEG